MTGNRNLFASSMARKVRPSVGRGLAFNGGTWPVSSLWLLRTASALLFCFFSRRHHNLPFRSEETDEIFNLLLAHRGPKRRHLLAAIPNLIDHRFAASPLTNKLEVRAFPSADSIRSMAPRTAFCRK